jgi:hypothetical protein
VISPDLTARVSELQEKEEQREKEFEKKEEEFKRQLKEKERELQDRIDIHVKKVRLVRDLCGKLFFAGF